MGPRTDAQPHSVDRAPEPCSPFPALGLSFSICRLGRSAKTARVSAELWSVRKLSGRPVGEASQVGGQEGAFAVGKRAGRVHGLGPWPGPAAGPGLLLVAAPSQGPSGISLLQADLLPAEEASAAHPGTVSARPGCICGCECGWGPVGR